MKKMHPLLRKFSPLAAETFGPDLAEKVLPLAQKLFEQLLAENPDQPKAVVTHTHNKIYPCIALHRALQQCGITKADSAAFIDRSMSILAEPDAASIRMMLKIPGAYKLMPRIFSWVTVHQFGTDAGFAATFYPTGKDRCKFDMTRCLYCDTCRANNCPELIVAFCHTDDVTDGHMHPRLCWNRTKIMGDGGDVCDFDLYITD